MDDSDPRRERRDDESNGGDPCRYPSISVVVIGERERAAGTVLATNATATHAGAGRAWSGKGRKDTSIG
jgi:hypothetical protein